MQKVLELASIVESSLQNQYKTRPLRPSQKRRFREVQLPDGTRLQLLLVDRFSLYSEYCYVPLRHTVDSGHYSSINSANFSCADASRDSNTAAYLLQMLRLSQPSETSLYFQVRFCC